MSAFGEGQAAAWTEARFAAADEQRRRELDEALLLEKIGAPSRTHCPEGHRLDGVKHLPSGTRRAYCKACNRERARNARAAVKRAPGQTHCSLGCGRKLAAWNTSGFCHACRWEGPARRKGA